MSSPQNRMPPEAMLFQLLAGSRIMFAVSCVARLGIPDLVDKGPRSVQELAAQIGADAGALYRLMRMTASVGVLSEGSDGKFGQTPMSALLRRDASPTAR